MGTEVTVTIDLDGNTKVAVKGLKGKACKALTKDFEESLGKRVSDTDTPELLEQPMPEQVRSRG